MGDAVIEAIADTVTLIDFVKYMKLDLTILGEDKEEDLLNKIAACDSIMSVHSIRIIIDISDNGLSHCSLILGRYNLPL